MPSRLRLVLAALALAACGPSLPPDGTVPQVYLDVATIGAEAQSKYEGGRWAEAAVQFRRQAEAATADPAHAADLAGWRDQAYYNLACVLARDGRPSEAAVAFAESVAEGLRPVRLPDGRGGWVEGASALTIPHVLVDPDLDGIREEPAFRAALDAYVAADVGDAGATGLSVGPVVVVLRGAAEFTLPGGDGDGRPGDDPPPAFVELRGPVAPQGRRTAPDDRTWLLPDGDARWAVAAVRRALDRFDAARGGGMPGAGDGRGAPSDDVFLIGVGDGPATAALAAAVEMPERVAGFAAVGARQTVPAVADALAAVAERRRGRRPWTVVVGDRAAEDALAAALTAAGADVLRAPPESAAAAALAAWTR